MHSAQMKKAGILALLLVLVFIGLWELYWRQKGQVIIFNDDEALWANSRKQVYRPQTDATVFIGSSRIKYDLDIPTWESLTGEKAIQLAMVGTNPCLLLEDLADDENFKGKLIVDVTEGLFFAIPPAGSESAEKGIKYFRKETPAQSFSNKINYFLESKFVFLEESKFGISALLHDMDLPNREGVFSIPPFPKEFEMTTYDRQTYMTDRFANDTAEVKRQTDIWLFFIMNNKNAPILGDTLQQYLSRIKTAVDKISSRGGKVLFVRTPASGPLEEGSKKVFPRTVYWDALLAYTGMPGIHYEDYPETAGFICPEWSHLSLSDAVVYTKHLVQTLKEEQGWSFNK
jgi:hypothetical protein